VLKQLINDTVDSCRTDCSVAAAVAVAVHWLASVCASVYSAVPFAAAAVVVVVAALPPTDAAAV